MPHRDLSSATFAVVDVETTGLDPRVDRVVEVACLRVAGGHIVERFVSLVDPARAIPGRASDVHGIYAADVDGAPRLAELEPRLRALTADAVVVAHNARFDMSFLHCMAMRPVLCTMQMARRLVDAPSYRNETLRAHLQLRPERQHARAHRAEADADVTTALLLELLRRYAYLRPGATVADLLATIARPTAVERFAFGLHRGQSAARVPTRTLRRMIRDDRVDWPGVRHIALGELVRRGISA